MICYFFGTFDPIHIGHIKIASVVQRKFNFERIIFVPSYMPPHKLASGMTPFEHRYNMIKETLGVENVSDIELKMPIPSYTYRTIQKLIEKDNTDKINFIIGYDQFFKLESWKNPEFLKKHVNFIVLPRKFKNGQTMGKMAFEYFKNKGYSFEVVENEFLDYASNEIRELIKENKDYSACITKEVKTYIEKHGLYNKLAQRKTVG